MDRLESFGHLRDVDGDAKRVTAVISTGDVARDGAIIEPGGWDFSNYDRNPVVLWMHDADTMPFARTVERMATDKELIARAEFDTDDPMGETVFRKISNGYINATSVRWLPKRWEMRKRGEDDEEEEVMVFLEQELLEWSFVTIPADPGALILRADGMPFSIADYAERKAPVSLNLEWLGDLDLNLIPEIKPNGHAHANGNGGAEIEAVEALLRRHFERRNRRQDVDDMVVSALSRATGKTEERIRHEMAEGGHGW